jgi:26S proteasome regulatory subunit N13
MVHFCWRKRTEPINEPEIDLIMLPGDVTFEPYVGKKSGGDSRIIKSPTNGRIVVLRFSSSSQRHLFWLQSKNEFTTPGRFSQRDLRIISIVNKMLSGEEVDYETELNEFNRSQEDDNEDHDMEDADGPGNARLRSNSTGGAGADATGGDIREEGEEAREGGADGARA